MQKCESGFYQVNENTCDKCSEPCHECIGDRYNCTKCDANAPEKTPALFINRIFMRDNSVVVRGTCYRVCPNGYFIDKLIPDDIRCTECEDPCGTCVNSKDNCLSCNGVDNTRTPPWANLTYVYEGDCFDVCPNKTAPDMSTLKCLGCGTRCNQCGTAKDTCYQCVSGPVALFNMLLGGNLADLTKFLGGSKSNTYQTQFAVYVNEPDQVAKNKM